MSYSFTPKATLGVQDGTQTTSNLIASGSTNLNTLSVTGNATFTSTAQLASTSNSISGVEAALNLYGDIHFANATKNALHFRGVGVAPPATTTRSVGTKLVVFPNIAPSSVDYAIGIESSNMWFSTAAPSTGFRWYGGTTLAAALSGLGALSLASGLTAATGTFSGVVSGASFSGDLIGGTVTGTTGTFSGAVTGASLAATSASIFRTATSISGFTMLGTNSVDGTENTRIVVSGNTRSSFAGQIEYHATSTGPHAFYNAGALSLTISSTGLTAASFSGNVNGGTVTGTTASFSGAVSVATPTLDAHATTKAYTDAISYLSAGTGLTKTASTLSVNAAQTQITSVGTLSSLAVSGTLSTVGDVTLGNMLIIGGGTTETYTLTSSSKYIYNPAGTVASLSSTDNSVIGATLVNMTAMNAANGASGVFFGAVAGVGNGAANFVIGRRTDVTSWAESLRVDTSGTLIVSTSGSSAPAYTTRSAGTKLVVSANLGASNVDYAIGMEPGNMWFSAPGTSTGFKWYGGTSVAASLSGGGALSLTSSLSASTGTFTGDVTVNGTTDSTVAGVGAVTIAGGLYVAKRTRVNMLFVQSGGIYVNGGIDVTGVSVIRNTTTIFAVNLQTEPTLTTHATTKSYVDGLTFLTAGTGLTRSGGTLSVNPTQTQITSVGTLASLVVSGTSSLSGAVTVPTPSSANHATTKSYVDDGVNTRVAQTTYDSFVASTDSSMATKIATSSDALLNTLSATTGTFSGDTTTGKLVCTGASEQILFNNTISYANPSTSSRTDGTRIVVYPKVVEGYDYALGIGTSSDLWFSAADGFAWYSSSTKTMQLHDAIVTILGTTESSAFTNGVFVTNGGAGIAKNLNVGGNISSVGSLAATTGAFSSTVTAPTFATGSGSLYRGVNGLVLAGNTSANYISLRAHNNVSAEFLMATDYTVLRRNDGTTNSLYVDNSTGVITIDHALNISAAATVQGVTPTEFAQLANINSVAISNTQWAYLGALNQDAHTTSSPTFAAVNAGTYSTGSATMASGDGGAGFIFNGGAGTSKYISMKANSTASSSPEFLMTTAYTTLRKNDGGSSIYINNTTGNVSFDFGLTVSENATLNGVTTTELAQIANINAVQIPNAQWANLGNLDQSVSTSAVPLFAGVTIGTGAPTSSNHATRKDYVDSLVVTAGSGLTKTGTALAVNAAQPTITSVGVLTSLVLTGDININKAATGTGTTYASNTIQTGSYGLVLSGGLTQNVGPCAKIDLKSSSGTRVPIVSIDFPGVAFKHLTDVSCERSVLITSTGKDTAGSGVGTMLDGVAGATVTDTATAASATNATLQRSYSLAGGQILTATNPGVTYSTASTCYVGVPPVAGTNVTIPERCSLYVDGPTSLKGLVSGTDLTLSGNAAVGSLSTTGVLACGSIVSNATSSQLVLNDRTTWGNPTTITRSPGTRIVLFPDVSNTNFDYAMGIGTVSDMWFSAASGFTWYSNNNAKMMQLLNGGLSVLSTADSSSSTNGSVVLSGGMGIAKSLFIGGNASISGALSALAGTFSGVTNVADSTQLAATSNALSASSGAMTVNGDIHLYNGTKNALVFAANGAVSPPSFTNRSVGSKILIYPIIGSAAVDYAIGMESNNMWFSSATTSDGFKFYGGTSLAATLTGAGMLYLVSGLSATAGTFTGAVTASTAPTAGEHLCNRTYVDSRIVTASGNLTKTGNDITLNPSLTLTDVSCSGNVWASGAINAGGSLYTSNSIYGGSSGFIISPQGASTGVVIFGDGTVRISSTSASTSTTNGAFVVAGGVGVMGDMYGTNAVFSGTVSSQGANPLGDATYDVGTSALRWRTVYASNGLLQTSDLRLKTKVTDIPTSLGLSFVNTLKPVAFNLTTDLNGNRHMGLIAQDVETTLNEIGQTELALLNKDGATGMYSMNYMQLIGPLVKAVQELSARVNVLESALKR